jgi:hypothetical protein
MTLSGTIPTATTREETMARPATVGPEIYERVNVLVAEGKTRTQAFDVVGKERKSRPGTVAANYYRVARAQGQTGRRRKASSGRPSASQNTASTRTRRRSASANSNSDMGAIAQQIADLTQQLVAAVEERDARLRSLLG